MVHVATLISNPAQALLTREALDIARAMLPGAQEVRYLAPGIAADLTFDLPADLTPRLLADRIRAALGTRALDVVVQPCADRRKRLLVADMDSTMIGQECIDELADVIGIKDHVAAITERAMRGEIAFEPALRARVALLKGLPLHKISQVMAERIHLTPGGPELVATMKAHGAFTALVSGGFTLFTNPVAALIGFDENHANILELDGDVLAGRVREPILGRDAKTMRLIELRDRLHVSAPQTLAVGDGANDLGMLDEAGLGVAFHAKPKVAEAAHARIDHGDLTALLFMQGYGREDFRHP